MSDLQVRPTPKTGSEKETLCASLNNYRAVMVWKLDGLGADDVSRAMVPSGTNLLGMVKHLSWVELFWFAQVFAGEDIDDPHPGDPAADFRIGPNETTESITDLYQKSVAHTDAVIDAAGLDDISAKDLSGTKYSMRWLLVHMIEETARHAGHADIIREQIDGATGLFPT